MLGPVRLVAIACLCWCNLAYASTLSYSVEGVRGELKENVEAWLGEKPKSTRERSNFIASAEERIRSSLKALGYYRPDINIAIDRSVEPWKMIVEVAENHAVLINQIDLLLLDAAKSDPKFDSLLNNVPFDLGDTLNHGVYENFKKQLSALAQQRGYFDGRFKRARVEVNAEASTAKIIVHYASGQRYKMGHIELDNALLETNWFDSVMEFKTGDWFDWTPLQKLRSELQQTRFFSSVTVKPLIDQRENGEVPVVVELSAVNRHSFEFGLGYSTDTEERVSVGWKTPLINRYGHSQETRLEYSAVNPSGRFNYNIPLSHPLNDVLQLSAYLSDQEFGDITSLQKGLQVRREIRSGSWITSYSLRTLDESWEEGARRQSSSYVLPGVSFSHKTRTGSLVDPESGFHQVYQLEGGYGDLGSEVDLIRAYSNFRYVTPLGERHRLVARAELGAVFIADEDRDKLAPSLSFFTGGSQSLRGFDYQSIGVDTQVPTEDGSTAEIVLGGDRLVGGSIEYQYYVNETWRAAVFADAGDAFDEGEFDAHYGVGFGAHYLSPVGAIRLELATDLSEDSPSWRVHLNIGAEF